MIARELRRELLTLSPEEKTEIIQFIKKLREKGSDILTALEAGNANQGIPDEEVLAFSIQANRAVITQGYFILNKTLSS